MAPERFETLAKDEHAEEDTRYVEMAERGLGRVPEKPALVAELEPAEKERLAEVKARLEEHAVPVAEKAPGVANIETSTKAELAAEAFLKSLGADKDTMRYADMARKRGKSEERIALDFLGQEMSSDARNAKRAAITGLVAPAFAGVAAIFGPLGLEATGLMTHEAFLALGPTMFGAVEVSAAATLPLAALAWVGAKGWHALKESAHRTKWSEQFGKKITARDVERRNYI